MRIFYRLKRHSRIILLILLRDTAQTLLSQRMRAINSTNWILKNHCERTTACYSDGSTGKTEWVTFLGCRLNRYLTGPSSSSGGGNNNTNDQRRRIRRQRLVIHSLHWHHGGGGYERWRWWWWLWWLWWLLLPCPSSSWRRYVWVASTFTFVY